MSTNIENGIVFGNLNIRQLLCVLEFRTDCGVVEETDALIVCERLMVQITICMSSECSSGKELYKVMETDGRMD